MCLGDNRRIVKFSSAEDGLPIDKVIQTAFCDVLGGEVEHISVLIQIEEQWGERKVLVDLQAGADTGFSKRGGRDPPYKKWGGGVLLASGPIRKAEGGGGGGEGCCPLQARYKKRGRVGGRLLSRRGEAYMKGGVATP